MGCSKTSLVAKKIPINALTTHDNFIYLEVNYFISPRPPNHKFCQYCCEFDDDFWPNENKKNGMPSCAETSSL